jgi:HNH endonuclease
MIYLPKSTTIPASLAIEKGKKNGQYNSEDVLVALQADFHNKCYLCEQKSPTSINVEHFVPHREGKYPDLKFAWENLFWACEHCNKGKEYFERSIQTDPPAAVFLNCTESNHDVLNWIKYEIKPFPKEKVKLFKNNNNQDNQLLIENTIELLLQLYNGTTPQKVMEASNLREKLIEEICDFQHQLCEYYGDSEEEKNDLLKRIKRHLSKKSAFTAFKRWIVMENETFKTDFQAFFD